MPTSTSRHGGAILVDALVREGAEFVYCVPGESFLPVLDALAATPSIRTVVTRHEGAASNMADAYGKLTGEPGLCFVTRGPGATHASNGLHTARQDSTPMILFIGQVESTFLGREAFQEIDYAAMFGSIAKWVAQPRSVDELAPTVARAYALARSGRAGPVVVVLPDDLLYADAGVAGTADLAPAATRVGPQAAALAELQQRLDAAQRPLLVVGGSRWERAGRDALHAFAAARALPVVTGFRRQDLFDNRSEHYVGQLGFGASAALLQRVRDADLLLLLGSRLSEVSSAGYTLVDATQPRQTLIHVHPDDAELGRVYRPALAIAADASTTAQALAALPRPAAPARWADWTRAARADHLAYVAPPPFAGRGVDLAAVVAHVSATLPDDAVIANGAGNYAVWVHRFYRYRGAATELAPTNGAMGYGLPAAIAAKLAAPQRDVVCFAGDGCFMMYAQELATAMQYGAAVIVIVVDNGMLGTIRMHQQREYPGRVAATALRNPDFVALAQAHGAWAERVDDTAQFAAAFARARGAGRAALLHLRVDPLQITPQQRLDA
jgi:acetolactate synthase-1/2/3 large subunit